MSNILLVEPNYRTKYLPHGLMKISSYHKSIGDRVVYHKGLVKFVNTSFFDDEAFYPDMIYITSLFTYEIDKVVETINYYKNIYKDSIIKVGGVAASIMPYYIQDKTGIIPHVGLLEHVEQFAPDYSIFPDTDFSIIFTTRGCKRKCSFCIVNKIEDFNMNENWKNEFNFTKQKLVIQDNNFIMSPMNHQIDIVEYINKNNINKSKIDFMSGLDARLFTTEIANNFNKIYRFMPNIRFAFDDMTQDGYVQRAMELARTNKAHNKSVIVYCLYNYKDKPEDLYYRIKEISKMGHSRKSHPAMAYPMRYTPLTDTKRNFVGEHWSERKIKTLNAIMDTNFNNWWVSASAYTEEQFNYVFGKNGEEFKEILENGVVTTLKTKEIRILKKDDK